MGTVIGMLEKKHVDNNVLKEMQNVLSHRSCFNKIVYFQFEKKTNIYRYGGVVGNLYSELNIIVTFDGKIYNTDELTNLLTNSDLRNIELSDSDLFLQLYLQLGFKKTLQLIDGAFAVSLVDLNNQTVYIARDRMGIKPIYYYKKNNIQQVDMEYVKRCVRAYGIEMSEDELYKKGM